MQDVILAILILFNDGVIETDTWGPYTVEDCELDRQDVILVAEANLDVHSYIIVCLSE